MGHEPFYSMLIWYRGINGDGSSRRVRGGTNIGPPFCTAAPQGGNAAVDMRR